MGSERMEKCQDVANMENSKPDCLKEGVPSDGKSLQICGTGTDILTRLDLGLAYSSAKLSNLHILWTLTLGLENNLDGTYVNIEHISEESVENALVFDLSSSLLCSEVRELDSFMNTLRVEIVNAHDNIFSCRDLGEISSVMEERYHNSEIFFNMIEEQVVEMKLLSSKLQTALLATRHKNWEDDYDENTSDAGQRTDANSKVPRDDPQMHILRMLERSLARELDLEKKLLKLGEHEEHLKLKLQRAELQALVVEEAAEMSWGRFLEADNAAEVLTWTAKDLLNRLQLVQFNLNASRQRECETRSELQGHLDQMKVKETEFQKTDLDAKFDHNDLVNKSEVSILMGKVKLLEKKLRESEERLGNAISSNKASEEKLSMMEHTIDTLNESISKSDSRAEDAEAKVALLTETNLELTEELAFLKNSDRNEEKLSLLEKQLRELELQLQHSKISSEASQEQQNMLYSAIWDMETLIEELKSKVSKAEIKNETAEEQCLLLSETNFELNKELRFLKARFQSLETSFHQVNKEKLAYATEISIRNKLMMDMVMEISVERDRITKQLGALKEENKNLTRKLRSRRKDVLDSLVDNGTGIEKELFFFPSDSDHSIPSDTCDEVSMSLQPGG